LPEISGQTLPVDPLPPKTLQVYLFFSTYPPCYTNFKMVPVFFCSASLKKCFIYSCFFILCTLVELKKIS
jgi:hypothetical protein